MRHQAITETNVDQYARCHIVSSGHSEFHQEYVQPYTNSQAQLPWAAGQQEIIGPMICSQGAARFNI